MAKDLTVATVKAAKPGPKRLEIPDGKSRGLFLVIQPSGAKSWALRFRFNGKPKKLTIGRVLLDRHAPLSQLPLGEPHTLAEARTAADRARIEIAHGSDPTAKPEKEATALERNTVRAHVKRFIELHAKGNRSWREVDRQFNVNILPAIGDRALDDVTKADVVAICDALRDGGSPIMANRVFATLSKFFNWCVGRGALETSPCAGLTKPGAERSRDRVLSWAEVAALWTTAGDVGQPFGPIVRLLLLTGQRRSEVTGMTDAEIDPNRAVWTIPADRAKNGEPHTVPITPAAFAELDGVRRIGKEGMVFTTNGSAVFAGHQKAKVRMDSALQFNQPWRLHDLRRTVATGMAELGEPVHVVEAVLNHKSGSVSGIAAVYNRHSYTEEKRHALNAWARFLTDVITVEPLRIAYERMTDRRQFRERIHGPDDGWREYVANGFRDPELVTVETE